MNPKGNQEAIQGIAKNTALDIKSRISASHSYLQIAPREGQVHLQELIKTLAADEKRMLTAEFSGSNQGSAVILASHARKILALADFDISSAERIMQYHKRNPAAGQLLKQVKEEDAKTKKAMATRLKHLMKVTGELKGNVETGKALFNNWLGLVYQLTDQSRRVPFMPGVDPDDPLGLREREAPPSSTQPSS